MAPLVTLLLACQGAPPALPAGDPARPDIVLVSIDTLRADHLSVYGHDRPTSPFIDSLANAGVRFAHARSASPWTLPSHTTMLTGQLPGTHRVIEDDLRLDPSTPVLPTLLTAAGYATGGFVATYYVSRIYGFERGFDRFEDFGLHSDKVNLKKQVSAVDVVDAALGWLADTTPGKPAFLFLHVYDVHYPYNPPEPYASRFDRPPQEGDPRYRNYAFFQKHPLSGPQLDHQRAQYDEAIRSVDDQLARLDAALRQAGRPARWAVTSDHGEELGERGSWGHAHTLYAEQLRVPLILSGPGLPAGRVVADRVGTQDIAPTLAAWAGASGLAAEGLDLAVVLSGGALPARPFLAETSRFSSNRIGLLEGALRLEWDLGTGQAELFAPDDDPAEEKNLAAERPADVARLEARVEALLGSPWEAVVAGQVSTDGVLLSGGRRKSLDAPPGARFASLPWDAAVRWRGEGPTQGPWAATGGTLPKTGDPLVFHGEGETVGVTLDAAQREQLEALGYVEDADDAPGR